jgi:hypothetical protein
MSTITINGISVDPTLNGPAPSTGPPTDGAWSKYILIQTNPSLNDHWRAELSQLLVTILEYVPRYSYLCHYPSPDLEAIRALPYIAWAEVYPIGFKLAPALLSPEPSTYGSTIRTLPELAAKPCSVYKLDSKPKQVDIVFHENVNPNEVRQAVVAAARLDPGNFELSRDKARIHKARITLQPQYLPDVAAIDQVRHIEETRPPELLNSVARRILGIGAVNGGSPFEGEGQIVVVADSGFDIGKEDNVHPAFMNNNEAKSRVMKLYALGRPGNSDLGQPGNSDDPIGHGTHVAGSVLGDGTSDEFGPIRGTAPKARLIVQALFDDNGRLKLPADLHDLFAPPYDNDGARIHNDSWGSRPGEGVYDQQSYEVDDFVWNHRDFVICFAAGNEGSDHQGTGHVDPRSITAPGTAKNCITVGASESDRTDGVRPEFGRTYGEKFPGDFRAEPLLSDKMADNIETVAAISSRGPTMDQRYKPDVVAPGTFILSAQSRVLNAGAPMWARGDDHFYFHGGTSMASPLVAGCVALVRECLDKVHDNKNPSAALVKALLINGARPLNGPNGTAGIASIPNSEEGFGRVDMAATLGSLADPERIIFSDERTALSEEQEELASITIKPETSLLKVTLVWTDPPGEHLQNDLDLIVRVAGGEERHGNMDSASSDFDRANNVEQIVWPGVPAGDAEIIVRAKRITTPSLPQPYALVIRTA